ncbi:MAG: PBP1A family penicillin-binding protein [Leptospirales bacterium]|nr:PBP1A family penicillin-binding protein [Leptospirales bacterium]
MKKILIGIPLLAFITAIIAVVYTGLIYLSWLDNKEAAMDHLARYKQLIDQTEQRKQGYVYSYSDVDVSAKVVDLPTRIYDRNDEIIGEFFDQKREIVPYDFIPEWIVKGAIASEDRDFYNHNGVNFKGIFRAMLINVINLSVVQGGSTITQQLAKVLFTDMERNMKRKIYETFCAYEIEKHYDKQDILSMYLNLIYFGNGAYGVESASKMFFGKSINQCNVAECAMIIAVISSPRTYSPISNLDNSLRKTRRIMTSLTDAKFITEKQADYQYEEFIKKWDFKFDENKKTVSSLVGSFTYSSYRVNKAPFFNEWVRRMLVDKFGEEAIKKGGLSIYTTIDEGKQAAALASLRTAISAQREYHRKASSSMKNEERAKAELEKASNIEGALVAINPFTGEILCYAGGYEFTSDNQNDSVYQIQRQPGSSFKPIIYVAAIEDKDITPSSIIKDEPVTFKGGYSPKNYSHGYAGDVTAREAMKRSINVVAVKILNETGYKRILSIIQKSLDLSDSELKKRFGSTLSLALGTYELSPLENCILNSVIVNGGDYVKPYGIRYVKDYNGNIAWNYVEENEAIIREKRDKIGKIIDPRAAAVLISLLKGVLEKGGTAQHALAGVKLPVAVAGKTGTSNDYNDAWFVGYAPELVTAVWVGNKRGAISLGSGRSGGSIAAPVWGRMALRATSDSVIKDFAVPKGVSREKVCLRTGKVAAEGNCPETALQLFYEGSEPDSFCDMNHGN